MMHPVAVFVWDSRLWACMHFVKCKFLFLLQSCTSDLYITSYLICLCIYLCLFTEGFQKWMWRGLSFLLPFLFGGYVSIVKAGKLANKDWNIECERKFCLCSIHPSSIAHICEPVECFVPGSLSYWLNRPHPWEGGVHREINATQDSSGICYSIPQWH